MSFSTCLNCQNMVGGYEKYCQVCTKNLDLKQDTDYWKTSAIQSAPRDENYQIKRSWIEEELKRDKLTELKEV